jgi:hypothetical protein
MLTGETQGIVVYVDGQVANKSEYFQRGGFSVAAPGGPAPSRGSSAGGDRY